MIVIVHVKSYYDWEPVPTGVQVTEADKKAKRVKPAANGAWLMRVQKDTNTHTHVALPEAQLIAGIIRDMIHEKIIRTRVEGVANYLSKYVMPHHAHPKWMRDFEISDDRADEKLFRAKVEEQVLAGNLEKEDVEDMVEAYLSEGDHVVQLKKHFKVA